MPTYARSQSSGTRPNCSTSHSKTTVFPLSVVPRALRGGILRWCCLCSARQMFALRSPVGAASSRRGGPRPKGRIEFSPDPLRNPHCSFDFSCPTRFEYESCSRSSNAFVSATFAISATPAVRTNSNILLCLPCQKKFFDFVSRPSSARKRNAIVFFVESSYAVVLFVLLALRAVRAAREKSATAPQCGRQKKYRGKALFWPLPKKD